MSLFCHLLRPFFSIKTQTLLFFSTGVHRPCSSNGLTISLGGHHSCNELIALKGCILFLFTAWSVPLHPHSKEFLSPGHFHMSDPLFSCVYRGSPASCGHDGGLSFGFRRYFCPLLMVSLSSVFWKWKGDFFLF